MSLSSHYPMLFMLSHLQSAFRPKVITDYSPPEECSNTISVLSPRGTTIKLLATMGARVVLEDGELIGKSSLSHQRFGY